MIIKRRSTNRMVSAFLALALFVMQFSGVSVKADVLRPVSENAVYIIRNLASDRVMDIPNGESTNGLKLQTWGYNGTAAQQFKFIELESTGYFYIIPQCAHTSAIDCPSSQSTDGLRYQIWEQYGNNAQEFYFQDAGNGYYRIINRASNKALQDEDSAVVQRSISNDTRQFWKFEKMRSDYTYSNAIRYSGADPWVTQAGGYYYMCQSAGGITIYKAKNLEDLGTAKGTNVFGDNYTTSSGEFLNSYWAPELIWVRDHWYVYFAPAVNNGGNDSHRMYCLQGGTNPNNPLDGSYRCMGRVADWGTNKWAIDGTVFEYNGGLYFVWSGWDGDVNVDQRIYIASMSNPYTLSSGRVQISVPTYSWETNHSPHVNEGPEVIVKDGRVHIIYSASGSWTDDYCLALLTCSDGNVLNPSSWNKKSEPVFKKTESVFGVGHNSFVKSPDGTEDWIVYHAAKYSGGGWDRNVHIQSFTWKNNEPFFGEPVSDNVMVGKPHKNNETYVSEGKYYRFVNVATGRSMDIPNGDDANSLKIQTWTQNDSNAQQFSVILRSTGWYTIVPKCAPTRALDNPSGQTNRNVRQQTWVQNNNIAQNYKFEKLTDDTYRIINQSSLLALTDTGEGNGYGVEQQVLTNNENQQWRIVEINQEPQIEQPQEVFGADVQAGQGSITVVWGSNTEMEGKGQLYNIYLDGNKVFDMVGCASKTINNVSAGDHTVRITSVLNGIETSGVTANVNVNQPEQSTSNQPQNGYVTASSDWNTTTSWDVYFAPDWGGNPTGEYRDGGEYGDFGLKINNPPAGAWALQLKTKEIPVNAGGNYTVRMNVSSNMNASNIMLKDDIGGTDNVFSLNQGNNTVSLNFTASSTAQIVWDLGVAPSGLNMEITSFELIDNSAPETESESESETVTEKKYAAIEINGYQISTRVPGSRIAYTVSDPNNEIVESGLVYGLYDRVSAEDMVVGSTSAYVYDYKSTTNGLLSQTLGNLESARSYVMTMRFIENASYYSAQISARAYAKLSDGSIIYSDICTHSVYDVSDVLYTNSRMTTQAEHDYLYNHILREVNPAYSPIEYNWSGVIWE